MKTIYALLLLLLTVGTLRAQTAPDDEVILRNVLNSESPFYYPSLFTRYMAGDTTLTDADYQHLYYGYVYQPTYQPFVNAPAADQILMILEKYPEPTKESCELIVKYGNEVMQTEPFNPGNLNFLVYAYGSLGDTINEKINYHRLQGVLRTIKGSGTGLSEKSPWHVIYFSHPTDVMASLQLPIGKRQVVSRTAEFVPLITRTNGVKGYYFDFGRLYWQRPDKLPEKRSSGFTLNGIPLKKR